MRPVLLAATVAASLLLTLAGCSSEEEPTPRPDEDAAQTAKDAAAEKVAWTRRNYAQMVSLSLLPDTIAEMSGCDWLGSGPLDGPRGIRCPGSGGVGQLWYEGGRLARDLTEAQDRSSPGFIAAPSEEIAPLVEDTIARGKELSRTARAVRDAGCVDTGAGECASLRRDLRRAMGAMEAELDAWADYL